MCENFQCLYQQNIFIVYYEKLYACLSEIMQSEDIEYVEIYEFLLLKTKVCIAGPVHCHKWIPWFNETFNVQVCFQMYSNKNIFFDVIENDLEHRVAVEASEEDQRARFVFLYCVKKIFYKDLRKMLFKEIKKAQQRMWENNITKVKKTIASINKNLIT